VGTALGAPSATDPLDTILFSSPVVEIGKFRVRPGHRRFADSGPIQRHIVVFPRTLVRITHAGQDGFVAGPDCVNYYNRGQIYRRESVEGRPDRCEWFAFGWPALSDALALWDPGARDRPDRPFVFLRGPSDGASYAAQRKIVESLAGDSATEPSDVEERSLAFLSRLLAAAYGAREGVRRPRPRPSTLRRERDLAGAAKTLVAGSLRRPLRLERIASELGVSIFHLCRLFRRQTGSTLYEFRSRLRLAESLELLRSGSRDLTGIALDLGFSSHSHFTAAFRTHFGFPPSVFRERLPSRRPATPLEIRKTRPERYPRIALQADVIRKSVVPSPSTSPIPTASNPNVSPGTRHVYVASRRPSAPE
jgi:AraC family transcriptional regulator